MTWNPDKLIILNFKARRSTNVCSESTHTEIFFLPTYIYVITHPVNANICQMLCCRLVISQIANLTYALSRLIWYVFLTYGLLELLRKGTILCCMTSDQLHLYYLIMLLDKLAFCPSCSGFHTDLDICLKSSMRFT